MAGYVITVKIVEEGAEVEAVEHPGDTVDYDTLSTAVGGYIERVSVMTPEFPQPDAPQPFAFDIWVNEEGLLQALPYNLLTSTLARSSGWGGDGLVGDAIITSGVSEDGETRPLTEEQAIVIMAFFSTLEKFLYT